MYISLIILLLLSYGVDSSKKALFLHPMTATSHILAMRSLAYKLIEKGYDITIIRWMENNGLKDISGPHLTEIILAVNNTDGSIPMFTHEEESKFKLPMKLMWDSGTSSTAIPPEGFVAGSAFCDSFLSRVDLIKKLGEENFDVAIVDFLYNECSLAVASHLGLPIVGYWAITFMGGEAQYTTAHMPPSHLPMIMSHLSDVMSFPERLFNMWLYLCSHLVMQLQFLIVNYHIRRWIPGTPSPDVILANMSGVLINTHPLFEYPRALPPSYIEIGGIQIKEKPAPLPKNIVRILESSEPHGAVLFTLGSIFGTDHIPQETIDRYMRAFSRLDQQVLMKLKGSVKNIPKNVHILEWLPQQDILADNRTQAFMTHCGAHGVMEALTFGVPMVGVPVFADQADVLVRLKEKELAVGLSKESDEDTIVAAIKEVINNPKYKENLMRVSKLIEAEPLRPVDKAAFLVDLVVETKGAEHMKLSSRHLYWFQYHSLDIYCFIILIIYILYSINKYRKRNLTKKTKLKKH